MACWGLTAALLVRQAEKKLGFSLLEARPVPRKGAGLAIGLAALCILLNALDWGTLKVIGEFQKKGPLLFAGQYLYYAFEVVLVLLIAAFGQQFWEALRKGRSQFPFGGVVLCCTWGAIHTLSRGSLSTGLGVMAFGLMYGAIYVLLGRDARAKFGEAELKLAGTAAGFLGRQMEG